MSLFWNQTSGCMEHSTRSDSIAYPSQSHRSPIWMLHRRAFRHKLDDILQHIVSFSILSFILQIQRQTLVVCIIKQNKNVCETQIIVFNKNMQISKHSLLSIRMLTSISPGCVTVSTKCCFSSHIELNFTTWRYVYKIYNNLILTISFANTISLVYLN